MVDIKHKIYLMWAFPSVIDQPWLYSQRQILELGKESSTA